MVSKFLGKNTVWVLGLLGVACGHTPPPCPAPQAIPVILRAGDRLNADDSGQALPTTVRLYQLKDVGRLAATTLDQMLENDRAVLGDDLLSVSELTLYPGEASKPVLDRREGAAFLAVVVLFRRPVGSGWRAASKLPPIDVSPCHTEEQRHPWFRYALLENQINETGGLR
jgi:type VI secretion system VasD/TssJ family lipoprotein